MEFKDLATVSGKGGLFRVVKPTRTGVILESIDENKQRFMASMQQRVSLLDEISIYTTDGEGSVPLEDVLKKIHSEFGDDPGLDPTDDGEELKAFLKHVLPTYDTERVYVSDIKKILIWFGLLVNTQPDLLTATKKPAKNKDETEEKAD